MKRSRFIWWVRFAFLPLFYRLSPQRFAVTVEFHRRVSRSCVLFVFWCFFYFSYFLFEAPAKGVHLRVHIFRFFLRCRGWASRWTTVVFCMVFSTQRRNRQPILQGRQRPPTRKYVCFLYFPFSILETKISIRSRSRGKLSTAVLDNTWYAYHGLSNFGALHRCVRQHRWAKDTRRRRVLPPRCRQVRVRNLQAVGSVSLRET